MRDQAFGIVLKKIRKTRKLAQEDFDQVSSRTYLSALERGLKNPTLEKVSQLATVLNVHPLSILAATYLAQNENATLDDLLNLVRTELSALDMA